MVQYLNSSLINTDRTQLKISIKEDEFVSQKNIQNTMDLLK